MGVFLSVKDLQVQYSTRRGRVNAVDKVSFDVNEKEIVGLVGESGCGKSTVALALARLISDPPGRITGGQVILDGTDITKISESKMRSLRGSKISMIFQDPLTFFNPVMKVGDQIGESLVIHQHISKAAAREKAIEVLKMVRLPDPEQVANSLPFELSGGMRQRSLIALGLVCAPSIFIADEPTTALDVTVQAQILDLIKQLVKDLNISLILITHDLGIVAETCDRVYVMYAWKIVEEADVHSLYNDPKHPYTKGLLQSVLRVDEPRERLRTIEGTVPNMLNPPGGCRFHPRCAYAMPKCTTEEPVLKKTEGGEVACWLY